MSDLTKVSGLWLKDKKSGGKFMSGKTSEVIPVGSKVFIFRNDRKEKDEQPDYGLFVELPEDEPPESELATEVESYSDDSIPF